MSFEDGNIFTLCGPSEDDTLNSPTTCYSSLVVILMFVSGTGLGVILGSVITWVCLRPKHKARVIKIERTRSDDDGIELVPNDGQLSEYSFQNMFQSSKVSVTTSDIGDYSNNNEDIRIESDLEINDKINPHIQRPQSNIIVDTSYSVSTFGTHQENAVTAAWTMYESKAQTKKHNVFGKKRSFDMGFFPTLKNIKAEISPKRRLKKNLSRKESDKDDVSYMADEHTIGEFVVDSNPMAGDSSIYTFSDIISVKNQGSSQLPSTPKNDVHAMKNGDSSQPLTPATVSSKGDFSC